MSSQAKDSFEGTIRCDTSTPGTIMEPTISGVSVLKRYVDPEGKPYGNHNGNWRVLSARESLSYFKLPQFNAWFVGHGFNEELLKAGELDERAQKETWKKRLRG